MTQQRMERISLRGFSKQSKILLLKELGYMTRGDTQIIDKEGRVVRDKYTDEEVHLDRMVILPGSELILNDSPLSIAAYMQEYGDVL